MNEDECAGHMALLGLGLLGGLLAGGLLGGCGGDTVSPGVTASSQTAAVQASSGAAKGPPPPAAGPPRAPSGPPAGTDKSAVPSPLEAARLARMKALPILSALSDREKLGLLRQLADASPIHRLRALDAYPKLEALADRQREILLVQLEDIVPVSTPANGFVCECGNGVVHKMCVRESCLDRNAVGAACHQACGTLPMLNAACSATPECARGR